MGNSRLRDSFNPRRLLHSEVGRLPLDLGPFHRHVGIAGSMERYRMRPIRRVLGPLEPVAKFFSASHDAATVFSHEQIISGQQRHRLRTYIREDETCSLLRVVSRMLNAILERAVLRL